MTTEQIKKIKESLMVDVTKESSNTTETLGGYMRLILDGGIEFTTTTDFVIFDDANELLHCICINDDPQSQYNYPIKTMTAGYEILFVVESIYTKENFKKLIEEGFLSSSVSSAQKDFILKWVESTNNFAIQPMDATPYYPTDVRFDSKGVSTIKRDDGITIAKPINKISVKAVGTKKALMTAINNSTGSDMIMVDKSITIDEPVTFTKDVHLISNGAKISSVIKTTSDAKNVYLEGFNIDVENSNGSKQILQSDAESVYLKNCIFTASTEFYNCLTVSQAKNVEIDGCQFLSNNDSNVYNFIELTYSKEAAESITIKNCKFGKSKNNAISLYRFADKAIVNIIDNIFEYSGNAVRVSNYNNAVGVNINITNNRYYTTSSDEYSGFIFFQKAKTTDEDKFASILVTITNLIGPGGKLMRKNGTGQDQVWYTYNTDDEPVVIFM